MSIHGNEIIESLFSSKILIISSLVILKLSIQLITIQSGFYGISADDYVRLTQAFNWQQNMIENYPPSLIWLPLNHIILIFFYSLCGDLYLTGVLQALMFSTFSLIMFYQIANLLFDNHWIASLSCLLLIFIPFFELLGLSSLPNASFQFLILTGVYFLLKYLKNDNSSFLFSSLIFFSISTALRYEGWFFCIVVGFVLVTKITQTRKWYLIIFLPILLFFPVFWIMDNWIRMGDPLFFIYLLRAFILLERIIVQY